MAIDPLDRQWSQRDEAKAKGKDHAKLSFLFLLVFNILYFIILYLSLVHFLLFQKLIVEEMWERVSANEGHDPTNTRPFLFIGEKHRN